MPASAIPATTPTLEQTMMTLSGLAATAAVTRPSGEPPAAQQGRIMQGIQALLPGQPATAEWSCLWAGLTQDYANFAYLAQNTAAPATAPQYAVVLRGTQFSSLIDLAEDLEVSTLLAFPAGGNVSQGAMRAFTEILMGTPLLVTLQTLVSAVPSSASPTVFVTGHSLGGAMATMVSPILAALLPVWHANAALQIYTFAAPTAGDAAFAARYDQLGGKNYYNKYDTVPNAWANLAEVKKFFPHGALRHQPGPAADAAIKEIIGKLEKLANNQYTQVAQEAPLNPHYKVLDTADESKTTTDWLGQAAFQHQNNTYLTLLEAQLLPAGPTVTGLSVTTGNGLQQTVISGTNLTSETVVDFGIAPATVISFDAAAQTLTVTAPYGIGIVDVRVTNMFGTSPATAVDRFTYSV